MEFTLTRPDSLIQIFVKDEYYVLDFLKDPQINYLVSQIPGAEYGSVVEYKWTVHKSNYKALIKALAGTVEWKSPEELNSDKSNLNLKEETLQDVLMRVPAITETPYMKIQPYNFQKLAVAWAITPKGNRGKVFGGLLADLMGLGKTIEALAITGELKKQGKIKNCLVICPATLKIQWSQQIAKFTYEDSIVIEGDGSAKRLKVYDRVKDEEPFYTIINYELLYQREIIDSVPVGRKPKEGQKQKTKRVYGEYIDLNKINELGFDMVVIDEAHRMKNPMTQTAQAIRQINPLYKLLMTGTPIEKDLKNIFQLLDYLSPNILASESMGFEFRKKRFEDLFIVHGWNKFNKWKRELIPIDTKNKALLRSLVAPYMLRRKTQDVSDELPPMTTDIIIVGWEPYQKSVFDKIKAELKALEEKSEKIKTQEEALELDKVKNELLLYQQEVCDTPELLVDSKSPKAKAFLGKRKEYPRTVKLERLLEIMEELLTNSDEKVVIFTRFERMTRIIERELLKLSEKMAKIKDDDGNHSGFDIKLYTGKTPNTCDWKREKEKNKEKVGELSCIECPFVNKCDSRNKSAWFFQNVRETKVIVCNDAANYGVNLQKGRTLINFDLPDVFAVYDQRKGRIQRLGSEHSNVHVINLLVGGGDDSKYDKLMKQKEEIDFVVENDELNEEAIRAATERMQKEMLEELLKDEN